MKTGIRNLGLAALAVGLLFGLGAKAEKPVATDLATAHAERLVGSWIITFEALGHAQTMGLTVADLDGFIGATLDSPNQPEPRALHTITATDDGSVDFQFEMPFGGQSLTMHLVLRESAGTLSGKLSESNGIFSADVTGEEGALEVDSSHRASPTEARLTLADQKKVRVTFGNLRADGDDYPKLGAVEDGAVFRFVGSRATKLFTDADLQFGDTVVKTENVSPGYPGVYSLWLKRAGDAWTLVVNDQPDVWGTQHDPAHDVAEIPLTISKLDENQDEFLITLKQQEDGGELRLAWGNTAWTTDFKVSQ